MSERDSEPVENRGWPDRWRHGNKGEWRRLARRKILTKVQKLDNIAPINPFRIRKISHFRRVVERNSENTVVPGVKCFLAAL